MIVCDISETIEYEELCKKRCNITMTVSLTLCIGICFSNGFPVRDTLAIIRPSVKIENEIQPLARSGGTDIYGDKNGGNITT